MIGILACLACIPAPAAPNVTLVMADDMGWAQTSYYDHPILELRIRTPWANFPC